MGYIYALKNNITNKFYIGATTRTPEIRYGEHVRESRRLRSRDRKLYKDIIAYGMNSFKLLTITECNNKELFEKEKYYIELYDSCENGYNETFGGKGKSFTNDEIIKEIIEVYINNSYTIQEMSDIFGLCKDTIKDILNQNNIKIECKYNIIDFEIKAVDKNKNEYNFINFDECVKWFISKNNIETTKQRVKSSILRVIHNKRNTYCGYKFLKIS